jgi:hypothetical protein
MVSGRTASRQWFAAGASAYGRLPDVTALDRAAEAAIPDAAPAGAA